MICGSASAAALSGDGHLQRAIRRSTDNMDGRWRALRDELEDADALREAARSLRSAAIARLPELLGQLADNVEAAGGQVFFAADADEATGYILRLAHRRKAKLAVKSKSMVTEEIKLNAALAAAGVEAVETDLGEWAQQLDGEPPVAHPRPGPAQEQGRLGAGARRRGLRRRRGRRTRCAPSPAGRCARASSRADLGITGVNLGVAETGTLLTVTNEGNGRLTAGAPPVHVAVMGMERVVANWAEADLLLALLARAGAGVDFATYVNCVTGPRRAHELDGPDELHLVIVDNGRSKILGSPSQEALNCIRCGACLNACPVYRQIGGHAYGDVYSGPIGAVIVPLLQDTPTAPTSSPTRPRCAARAGRPARWRSRCTSSCSKAAPRTPAPSARSGAPGRAPGPAPAPSPSPAPPRACAPRRPSSPRRSAPGPRTANSRSARARPSAPAGTEARSLTTT